MKKYVLHETFPSKETHIDFRSHLNDQQYEVVTKAEGPCLVLAGAGSGKTRTLIYRLAYLLERGVPPRNILLMTFTNKAAHEMRDRTEMLLKYKPKGLWSGTFHHVGNKSLRMYAEAVGYKKDFTILDEHDSQDLIKACMKGIEKVKGERFPKPSVVRSIISLSVNTKKSIQDILDEKYPYFWQFSDEIEKIKDIYQKKKKTSNSMDYDDLLSKWKELLETIPQARKRFTEQFKYILVDEYQDTNFLQADIIDILAEHHKNVLVVGDDAQAIYSFRGARVDNILKIPDRFRDVKIFKLETNYRSTPEVLDLANDSLKNNEKQFHKELKAVNDYLEKPALVEVKDLYSQASFVAQRVLEMREEGLELKDIAVLFRAHYQAAELEMELVKRGIPYIVRGGIRFFEQAHIKDVLSFLRIIVNPTDEISWMRALTLCPGIGPGYASRIYESFRKGGSNLKAFLTKDTPEGVPPKARSGYSRFYKIMKRLVGEAASGSPGDIINLIMEEGYHTHLLANYENAKDRVDDIRELVNFSHDYKAVQDFLNDVTLRENFRGETVLGANEDDEQLVLSTIHQAKGLEWDAVIIIGLCEGQFPHPKAMKEESEIEEERRLFYVASTRAKKYLYLMHPATRYDYQMGLVVARRSRFLEELNSNLYEVWAVEGESSFSEDEDSAEEIISLE